jgi:hypothetical protein
VYLIFYEDCQRMNFIKAAAMKPPSKMGARAGGGASGATSQLTS